MIVLFLCTNYLISVGKNNRYEQPNQEALNILEKSKIYRTDQDGSVMFKIVKKICNIFIRLYVILYIVGGEVK